MVSHPVPRSDVSSLWSGSSNNHSHSLKSMLSGSWTLGASGHLEQGNNLDFFPPSLVCLPQELVLSLQSRVAVQVPCLG